MHGLKKIGAKIGLEKSKDTQIETEWIMNPFRRVATMLGFIFTGRIHIAERFRFLTILRAKWPFFA